MVFTKQYGCRFSSCDSRTLSPRISVLDLDFSLDEVSSLTRIHHSVALGSPREVTRGQVGEWGEENRVRLRATADGVVHAVLASWEVRTHPAAGGAPN